jgi:hypothetical protein
MNPIQPTQVYNNVIPLSNYMTYDLNSLNPYNYKDFQDKQNTYQNYQDLIYYTRQINPISMVMDNVQMRDPSNLPPDIAFRGIYASGDASNRDPLNIQRSISNNPNLWRDKQPVPGYQQAIRPISSINAGHASSQIYSHGYLIN